MPKTTEQRITRQLIFDTVSDAVLKLVEYDRREDEGLSRRDLEQALYYGTISLDEIVWHFRSELLKEMPWLT